MFAAWNPAQPEITDLLVQYDPGTLQRLPVRKQQLLEVFARFGNRQASRAVTALSEKAGVLDDHEIDALLLTVHWEMQRLAEEFYHGHRVWELLRPVVTSIRRAGVRETLRIVDLVRHRLHHALARREDFARGPQHRSSGDGFQLDPDR
jgi:hypothetical protein